MDQQTFIADFLARNFPAPVAGRRARGGASISDAAKMEQAQAAWLRYATPNRVMARALIAAGGKDWDGERVYFNEVPVGAVGRTADVYFDIQTGAWVGDAEAVATIVHCTAAV